jgi:spermidine/putrescine ABC transporter ATP-binding subunit
MTTVDSATQVTSPHAVGERLPVAGSLELRRLAKSYGGVTAVREVDLDIAAGEWVTLLGSSGSGKTTTLLMIAGFEQPTSGELILDGRSLNGVPAHRRNIGMMFQSYSLFPHMTVAQNIAYPLKIRRTPRAEIRTRVGEALELVHLTGYGKRYPSELSGGQQQRIALARATVYRPPLLLMDEPLSALDRRLRASMQDELKRIHRDLGTTVVYVTHDQDEALALSDRIVLMHNGGIEQIGSPADIYDRPVTRFAAEFVGESTFLRGRVRSRGADGTVVVALGDGTLVGGVPMTDLSPDDEVVVAVRPERIAVAGADATGAPFTGLRLEVRDRTFLGERVQITGTFPTGERGVLRVDPGLAHGFADAAHLSVGWAAADAVVLPDAS